MIHFRPLSADDFPMLLDWLQRPHILEWWDDGDDTIEKVAAHYSRDAENTKRFIAQLDGEGAGYFPYHRFDTRHVGIDQFLARGDGLSKGIGTTCLRAFMDMIADIESPEVLSVDPHPENKRAIRCYEKCGFVHAPAQSTATAYCMLRKY